MHLKGKQGLRRFTLLQIALGSLGSFNIHLQIQVIHNNKKNIPNSFPHERTCMDMSVWMKYQFWLTSQKQYSLECMDVISSTVGLGGGHQYLGEHNLQSLLV